MKDKPLGPMGLQTEINRLNREIKSLEQVCLDKNADIREIGRMCETEREKRRALEVKLENARAIIEGLLQECDDLPSDRVMIERANAFINSLVEKE